jgi:hypothetical protein
LEKVNPTPEPGCIREVKASNNPFPSHPGSGTEAKTNKFPRVKILTKVDKKKKAHLASWPLGK